MPRTGSSTRPGGSRIERDDAPKPGTIMSPTGRKPKPIGRPTGRRYWRRRRRIGRRTGRPCWHAQRRYYVAHRAAVLARAKAYYVAHREAIRVRAKAYSKTYRTRHREERLQRGSGRGERRTRRRSRNTKRDGALGSGAPPSPTLPPPNGRPSNSSTAIGVWYCPPDCPKCKARDAPAHARPHRAAQQRGP